MAYFECTIGGSSGEGVSLVVECSSSFAGSVITADNGVDSFSETCPSVSPYTVKFEGIPIGTYTISGEAEGQTFTTQFTVLDYSTTLSSTPDGATVIPTDDIQTWLHCANIWDKNYSTISQVLADTTTLLALVSSNNAADYMARSTTWASDVCANQTAMGYIGNNDYCADKLLDDSTWRTAIVASTYFESVLTVKVPTMTSYTTPSGQVVYYTTISSDPAWRVFDGSDSSTGCYSSNSQNGYVGYQFTEDVKIYRARIYTHHIYYHSQYKIQSVEDGQYIDRSAVYAASASSQLIISVNPENACNTWVARGLNNVGSASSYMNTLQFWGR